MVEIGVAQLRRELKDWLKRAKSGDEVVITDRGRPIARLSGIDATPVLERLVERGELSRPTAQRPKASGRKRVKANGEVAELVIADRDVRR